MITPEKTAPMMKPAVLDPRIHPNNDILENWSMIISVTIVGINEVEIAERV
ncbi:hypothetical protein HVA01_01840 [Halovibrio variabilis]|uniref:Uncharacterized protein n=1 Tax=Halovibrio variabilis TaxID=31910 RepID=A0A511ULK7_9GAMM|nr:hypothetical protein HVA01_01840 [Halovibrio variabilis]